MTRQVVDAVFLEELLDPGGRVAAGGQCDDLEFVAAEFFLQLGDLRHFLAAGRAPRGPEVYQNVFALVVGQRGGAAVIFQLKFNRGFGFGLFVQDQPFQRSVAQRSQSFGICGQSRICTQRKGHIKGDQTK